MKNKRVLVTGASGHLGSGLVEHLVSKGARVWGTTRYSEKVRDLKQRFPGAQFLAINLLDHQVVERMLRENRFTDVFHLAGESTPGKIKNDREEAWQANVEPARVLMKGMLRTGSRGRIFLAGSTLVYRDPLGEITEESPTITASCGDGYKASKIAQEELGMEFVGRGLDVVRLRLSQVSGPGRPMGRAETDFALQMVLMKMGRMAVEKGLKVKGDLSSAVDILSIRDTVQALELLLETEFDSGEAVNVVSGRSRRVGEMIGSLAEAAGLDRLPIHEFKQTRLSIRFSHEKLSELTGWWGPRITLEETMEEVFKYCQRRYEQNPELVLKEAGANGWLTREGAFRVSKEAFCA